MLEPMGISYIGYCLMSKIELSRSYYYGMRSSYAETSGTKTPITFGLDEGLRDTTVTAQPCDAMRL